MEDLVKMLIYFNSFKFNNIIEDIDCELKPELELDLNVEYISYGNINEKIFLDKVFKNIDKIKHVSKPYFLIGRPSERRVYDKEDLKYIVYEFKTTDILCVILVLLKIEIPTEIIFMIIEEYYKSIFCEQIHLGFCKKDKSQIMKYYDCQASFGRVYLYIY